MNKLIQLLIVFVLGSFCLQSVIAADLSIKHDYKLDKLGKVTYVIHGPNEAPSKQNQGFRNNPVLVKTSKGIVVIDPGTSVYTGELVVKKAREISGKPIVAVFNSHVHGDHWLGNHGIKKHYKNVVIYSHPKMKTLVEAGDGEMWIKAIMKRTEGMIKGTKVVGPNKTVKHGDKLQIGDITFRIHHYDKAHTDHDIMIEIVEEKVLVCGDNLRNKNLSMFLTSFKGNLRALDLGVNTGARVFVPGHGLSGDKSIVDDYRKFLTDLKGEVRKHFEAGLSDFEMKPKIIKSLDSYKGYANFDENIGRLINLAYLEVENESF